MSKALGVVLGTVAVGAIATVAAVATINEIESTKDNKKDYKQNNNKSNKKFNTSHLKYNPKQQSTISLLSYHGKYVSCKKNGIVKCDAKEISNNEIFISIPIHNYDSNDKSIKIALRSFNGKYVSAQPGNKRKKYRIECNRNDIASYEIFIVEKHINNNNDKEYWSFKSVHNKYFSAQFFNGKLIGNRDECKDWEKFKIQIVDWEDDDDWDKQ